MVYPHIQYGGPAYPGLQSPSIPAGTRELHSRQGNDRYDSGRDSIEERLNCWETLIPNI